MEAFVDLIGERLRRRISRSVKAASSHKAGSGVVVVVVVVLR